MTKESDFNDGFTPQERALDDYRRAHSTMADVQKYLGAQGLLRNALMACEKWCMKEVTRTHYMVLYMKKDVRKLFTTNVENRLLKLLRKDGTVTLLKFVIISKNGRLSSESLKYHYEG